MSSNYFFFVVLVERNLVAEITYCALNLFWLTRGASVLTVLWIVMATLNSYSTNTHAKLYKQDVCDGKSGAYFLCFRVVLKQPPTQACMKRTHFLNFQMVCSLHSPDMLCLTLNTWYFTNVPHMYSHAQKVLTVRCKAITTHTYTELTDVYMCMVCTNWINRGRYRAVKTQIQYANT